MAEEPCIPLGTVIGQRLRLDELLRRGDLLEVFAAVHLPSESPCTVKVLRPSSSDDPDVHMRFMTLARMAGRVLSEHVESALDAGVTEDGLCYEVFGRPEGSVLSDLLAGGRRSNIRDAVEYALQISRALGTLHKVDFVHRELRPENLLVARRPNGSPLVQLLMDLRSGVPTLETAPYMSPEQLNDAGAIDHRTDLYALGVVLYELLAGRHPFAGDTLEELVANISSGERIPLREVRAEVPLELARVVERAFHRDRDERYGGAEELSTALLPFRDPSSAPPPHRSSGNAEQDSDEAKTVDRLILERLRLASIESGEARGLEGRWLGRLAQSGVALSTISDFTLELEPRADRVSGRGRDPDGPFQVEGTLRGQCLRFRKLQEGGKAVDYVGRLRDGVVAGGWRSEKLPELYGLFAMARAERCPPRLRSELERRTQSRGRVLVFLTLVLPLVAIGLLVAAVQQKLVRLLLVPICILLWIVAMYARLHASTELYRRWWDSWDSK